jgi:hypothetical protein
MLCAPTFATARGVRAAEKGHEAATVTPILQIQTGKTTTLRVRFNNTTQNPIRYFGGMGVHLDKDSPGDLRMSLSDNEGRTYRAVTAGRPHAFAENVYVLKPGESIDVRFSLPGDYEGLEPGRYDIRITYDIKENDGDVKKYGITPMSIDKSILTLDVVEARAR